MKIVDDAEKHPLPEVSNEFSYYYDIYPKIISLREW
jgi:hypothetical protein